MNLPTTQKAVVNSIIAKQLGDNPYGYCKLYTENRYSAPEIFVMLKLKYKILAYGTIRPNKKGWNSDIMA